MTLHQSLTEGDLQLRPLVEDDREGLRRACAADDEIWGLYPVSYGPDHFDRSFSALLANPARRAFSIRHEGHLIGMSAYLRIDEGSNTLEIGNSYIVPQARGTGINGRMKRLMIDHAFAQGFRRIEFRIDERNPRSQAAVLKLGALQEGLLRAERITWTGHVRNTLLFGLLENDWTSAQAARQKL